MTVFCELIIFFFFNDTATTEIYTLSLHDALPIWSVPDVPLIRPAKTCLRRYGSRWRSRAGAAELGGLACVLRVRASTRRIGAWEVRGMVGLMGDPSCAESSPAVVLRKLSAS